MVFHPVSYTHLVEIGEKNGIDAVAELKLTAPDTPVLFVSSHIAGSEVARALRCV